MANIFVTGASGFVGSAFVDWLLERDHKVTGLARSEPTIVHPNYTHVRSSMENARQSCDVLPKNYDALVHLAWAGSGGPGRDDVGLQLSNIQNTDEAVHLTRELGAVTFVGVGTISEAEVPHTDLRSGVSPGPGYFYGLSKVTAQNMSKYTSMKLGLSHIWAQLGNTYGLNDPTDRLLSSTLKKMLRGETAAFSSGTQMYDFVYLDDALQALELLATQEAKPDQYYVGSGRPQSLRSFIEELASITETKSELVFGAPAGAQMPAETFSVNKLREQVGYSPAFTFRGGILTLINELETKGS